MADENATLLVLGGPVVMNIEAEIRGAVQDYPVEVNSIAWIDRQLLVNTIVGVAKIGPAYGLSIAYSTVNVKTGLNKLPIIQLRRV